MIGVAAFVFFSLLTGTAVQERLLHQDAKPFVVHSSLWSTSSYWDRKPSHKYFRVLALDGGGVRGIIQLVALQHLERLTGKPISELFDGFIATSVGSATCVMLLIPDYRGKPMYTTDDVMRMVFDQTQLQRVFSQTPFRLLMTANGAFGPRYSGKSKAELLQQRFKDTPYNHLLKPVVITSWSTETLKPHFLANWTHKGYEDWPVWAIVHGATSPPGYFPPTHVTDFSREGVTLKMDLNDGGVYVNTPITPVLLDMFTQHLKKDQQLLIVNIGTGFAKDPYPFRKTQKWGMLSWFSPLFNSMGTLSGRLAYEQLKALTTQWGDKYRVFVINTPVDPRDMSLDDIRAKHLQRLKHYGKQMVDMHAQSFQTLAELLRET